MISPWRTLGTVKDVFASRISPELKNLGFKKERHTWRLFSETSIRVLNLQNSGFSSEFFVNFGVLWVEENKPLKPLEYQCDARTRLSALVPDDLRVSVDDRPEISIWDMGYQLTANDLVLLEPFIEGRKKLLFEFGLPRLLEFPNHNDDTKAWWTVTPTP